MTKKNENTVDEKMNESAASEAGTAAQKDLAAENAARKAYKTKSVGANKNAVAAVEVAGPKMVKIRIPRTKADQEDVFVSVNNYTCIIKRGVEVEVPDYVAEVLRHQEEMLEKIMLFEEAAQKKDK